MSTILYGSPVAEGIFAEIKQYILDSGHTPGLAIVQVGHHPASDVYVSHKEKAAKRIGVDCQVKHLSEQASQSQLSQAINQLNQDPTIHGIIVQLPLPPSINASHIINQIDPNKDVDGLTSQQQSFLGSGMPQYIPATALAILKLIKHYRLDLIHKNIVVVGRSTLVGKPIAHLLEQDGHTVEVIHRQSANPNQTLRQADIIISATGQANLLNQSNVKPGATIIDVGITRTSSGLVGDANFQQLVNHAKAITPVPGGIGPITIACLMLNVVHACKQQYKSA